MMLKLLLCNGLCGSEKSFEHMENMIIYISVYEWTDECSGSLMTMLINHVQGFLHS